MCRRVFELVCLALAATATTTSAFLLPSPASPSSSTTAHNTRCYATAPTSQSSSSPLQQVDRLGALRFLAGAVALPALVVLAPGMGSGVGSAFAQDSSPAEEALTRVIIVKDSTAQLEDELTNGNSYPDVKALVTSLLRNYQLKSSMDSALALLPPSLPAKTKEDAKLHAKIAYENLTIILEYFPADQSGPLANKTLKPDQLNFTIKALQATRKELDEFMGFFDEGLREKLAEGVAST